jgi:hypothetical protein
MEGSLSINLESAEQDSVTRRGRQNVRALPSAKRLVYVPLYRAGVRAVIVQVSEDVLDDPRKCASAEARAYLYFHIPAVLVSRMGHRVHGRLDVVGVLRGVDVSRLRWRVCVLAA